MGKLTIGAFARASRLSAKALRRYDDLGLLPPASVDESSGYRYYDVSQLERARLVAWLRRIEMPLARIGEVCDLHQSDPTAAAHAVRAYWAQVEADVATRRDLAFFLADQMSQLSGEAAAMTSLGIRYAARTDPGLVRETNQDAAYATSRLLAVADGYGGQGATASLAAIDALRELDGSPAGGEPSTRAGDLLNALEDAVQQADTALHDYPDSGSTLTAMVWTGSRLALVHIGDTRAQLLRGGELFRITHDHTVTQAMVDAGSLTQEEAASHPQRALLLRALGGSEAPARPDLRLHEARAGDRYLLCSDGLFTVVPDEGIRRVLESAADPEETVSELIALAHREGGPDNIACVVADVVPI
ncbi:MerR family transcriptional regulator [Streptomyces albipurpureus]|uniref:MerR family transcriptional regulator n=1 Tax=Streptomyces albipurpureus TaxID=2897419 RepID=A0ABT0UNY1_9ACTN|nr:MerR family transcriptional regulator [Streptomyces sp. CWNU-1]MCM2388961.1 MerR family transcriptional regulator [Streptomyces sp. CWNU-1]